MKPSLWPDQADVLKAKSEAYGGETLVEHTWDVLEKLAELRQLRPQLAEQLNQPQLWHYLYWACLLHDFGKAALGFQNRLAGGAAWKHRHEVLSLLFLSWIQWDTQSDEQKYICAAIASHHRDAAYISTNYPALQGVKPLLAELSQETREILWDWLGSCANHWFIELGFTEQQVQTRHILPKSQALELAETQGAEIIFEQIQEYLGWIDYLEDEDPSVHTLGILLRGLTTSADHMASAHLKQMPAPIQKSWHELATAILKPGQTPYQHQQQSAEAHGESALLISPTGSGKTEAACYWALGEGSQPIPRIFYALPYQASMNAMFDRLRDTDTGFGSEAVGLQHGRALQALYARMLDNEEHKITAAQAARWQKNINTLNARPLKIFSPYQMLKTIFQIRGFEAMLTDYAGAAFIFDEIHAYEPNRLAMIICLMQYLRETFSACFFVMSATFPDLIKQELINALADPTVITASPQLFQDFCRHRLELIDGDLLSNGIDVIVSDLRQGKQVLVCVNTIKRAQEVEKELRAKGVLDHELLLIHGRYIFRHRNIREQAIMERCGLNIANPQPLILIATQVVEVSLNIDLDTIYSDPAPLEALLQRFGRVNRARKKGICPVHVFTQPDDGQGIYGRNANKELRGHIIRVTLSVLRQHNQQIIDEAQTEQWLNQIYSDPQLKTEWQDKYNATAKEIRSFLKSLYPFNSNDDQKKRFEELFDGYDVVPKKFEQQYIQHIVEGEYIEASQYMVNISAQRFGQFYSSGLIQKASAIEDHHVWIAKLQYDDYLGLQYEPYNPSDDDL
jgi:CRISPR-associated endonuclease/helicase Cas3